jgi:hypothetical protein
LRTKGDNLIEFGVNTFSKIWNFGVKETIEYIEKLGAKTIVKEAFGRSFTTGMKAIGGIVARWAGKGLKWIPGIGLLFGLAEYFDYMNQDNPAAAFLALGSGIASIFPGVGTAISILLDVANIGLTGTETGRTISTGFKMYYDSFMKFLRKVPIIGSLIHFSEALGHLSSGDFAKFAESIVKSGLVNIGVGFFTDIDELPKKITNTGESLIKWFGEKWDATKTAIHDSFSKFFSWIGNLGTAIKDSILEILPERIRKWFESGEDPTVEKARPNSINNQIMGIPSQYRTPSIKGQAVIEQPKNITFQPANEDKLYTMDQTSVFAKPDDILGKTFENINKQLSSLNNQIQKNTKILIEHTEIFQKILDIDQQQLNMLPALASTPETNDKQFPLSNIESDRIYAYRNRIRENRIGRI